MVRSIHGSLTFCLSQKTALSWQASDEKGGKVAEVRRRTLPKTRQVGRVSSSHSRKTFSDPEAVYEVSSYSSDRDRLLGW